VILPFAGNEEVTSRFAKISLIMKHPGEANRCRSRICHKTRVLLWFATTSIAKTLAYLDPRRHAIQSYSKPRQRAPTARPKATLGMAFGNDAPLVKD
jgi:hypothetical protein